MDQDRGERIARARFFYQMRATGFGMAITPLIVTDFKERDGVMTHIMALIVFAGIAAWLVAVVQISEIYGIGACLTLPPKEVLHYRKARQKSELTGQTQLQRPAHASSGPSATRHTISCHGDVGIVLGGMTATEIGLSIISNAPRRYPALLSATLPSAPTSGVEVWIDGKHVTTLRGVEIDPYLEVLQAHNVNLSTYVYGGDGDAVAALADPAATVSEARGLQS